MMRSVFLVFGAVHLVMVIAYWLLSGEAAGTVLLFVFGLAILLMGWMLIPTAGDIGPTAPVDPDWHETNR